MARYVRLSLSLSLSVLSLCSLCAWTAAEETIGVVGEEDTAAERFHRCLDPTETGSAIVDKLPRYAADMQRVPSGPEEYAWFRWDDHCDAEPLVCIHKDSAGVGRWRPSDAEWGEPCAAGCYEMEAAEAFDVETGRALERDSAGRYIQGAVLYGLVFFVLSLVALSLGFLCMGWTFCGAFVCCCCKSRRAFPCCCLSAPARTGGGDEDEEEVDDDLPDDIGSCWYKQKTKFCFRLFVVVPLSLMLFTLFLGNARGNAQFVDSVNALIDAPRGFASISNDAFSLGDHVLSLPLEILDEIVAINQTVSRAVDFPSCSSSLQCIQEMLSSLPDVNAITAELLNVQDGLALLPSSTEMTAVLTALFGTLEELQTELGTIATAADATGTKLAEITSDNTGNLDQLKAAVATAVATQTAAQSAAADVQTEIAAFLAARPALDPLQADLATLANSGTASTFEDTTPSGNNPDRNRLLSELLAARDGVENVNDAIQPLTDAMDTFTARVGEIDFSPVLTAATALETTLGEVPVSTIVTAVQQVTTVLTSFTLESSCAEADSADGSDDAASCGAVPTGVFAASAVREHCAPTAVTDPPTDCNSTFVPGDSSTCQEGDGCTYIAPVAARESSRSQCEAVATTPSGGGEPVAACTYQMGMLEILGGLQQMIDNHMPDVAMIQSELQKVNTTLQSISCMDPLIAAVVSVNETLVRVPPATDDIMLMLTQTQSLTDQVGDITTQVSEQMASFGDSTDEIRTLDIPSYKADAEGLQLELNSVDLSSLETQTDGMQAALDGVDVSSMTADIEAAQTALAAIDGTIPSEVTDALTAFGDNSADAISTIQTTHDAIDNCKPSASCTVTALNTNGDIDNFIVFVQALEDSLIELAALSDLSDAVQALRDAEVPDTGAIDSALDGAKSSIQSGESGIDAARSSVTDIEAQLTTASQGFTTLRDDWDSIGSIFDEIGPMLEGAIQQVVGVADSLDALPSDAVEMVGTFKTMVDQLITMQANLGQNITDAKATIDVFREDIAATREGFLLWRMFHGENKSFVMPNLEGGVSEFLNSTAQCETVECFQAAAQFLDDNLLDVMSHVVGAQIGMEPVILGVGRTEAFVLLYMFTALGAALAIVGACILNAQLRAVGACILWPTSFFFLLLGTILFPTMVIMSDTCGGAEHLAYNLVQRDSNLGLDASALLIKDKAEVQAYLELIPYNFSKGYDYPIEDVMLPGLPDIVSSYFGTCPAPVAGTLSVDGAITDVGDFAENTTVGLINFAVEQVETLSGEIRPALRGHVNTVKRLAEEEVGEVFERTGALLSCPRVNDAYFYLKDAFCCEFVVMLYWMAASSVAIGCTGCWGICCVGCTTRSLRRMPSLPPDDISSESDDDDIKPPPRQP